MIVLDAGVLIALFNAEDLHHAAVTSFLAANIEGPFVTNVLALAEGLVHPTARGDAAESERFFDSLGLHVLTVPNDAAVALAEVRHATRLRMPDAVVVFTAEHLGARIVTTDRALARAAGDRGLVVHLLDGDAA
ncbi:MAG: type II toxin-antitoxin system VapC family toxin [Microbacterium sp.]